MSTTNTRPTRATRRKRSPNPNWREDFYRNGRPDEQEVIVISDSPTPSPTHIRQLPSQIETRGMKKRGRRSPPYLSNPQLLQSSQVPLQPISTALTHKRRRKGEIPTIQTHQQYNDTSYRSYISASSHTSVHYREPISAREVRRFNDFKIKNLHCNNYKSLIFIDNPCDFCSFYSLIHPHLLHVKQ